jgi:hypothetical protein
MIEALGGSKYFVTIEGMPHGFRIEDAPEVFGWTFMFLSAHLSRNQADRVAFHAIENVPSAADDRVKIRKTLAWGSRDEQEVVEYVNPQGKHFMTGRTSEISLLDALPTLWQRTGQRFATWRTDAPIGSQLCRIYASDSSGLSTHFYSSSQSDCALVRAQSWAHDEGYPMRVQDFLPQIAVFPAPPPVCPADTVKIHRWFNSRLVNHRYLTESLAARTLPSADQRAEGPVFCAAKYED